MDENQRELEKATDPEEQMICMKTSLHLKEVERELTKIA
jgi:hypothetical protein